MMSEPKTPVSEPSQTDVFGSYVPLLDPRSPVTLGSLGNPPFPQMEAV